MREPHVLIIGAGIGGLTAALALQRAGARVSLFEAAAELGEVGAGLTLASNGSRVLQHLGLGPVLEAHACVPAAGAVLHFRDGRRLVEVPHGEQTLRRYGAPYCQIHRADLHAGLSRAVLQNDPGCLHLRHRCTGLAESAAGITAHFAAQAAAEGDLLIGCDGIHSVVRAALFGRDEPRFTGFVAWRGLVPVTGLPRAALEPDTAVIKGPGRYVTRYKIRGGRLLNYVAVARTGAWSAEGWSVPCTVAAVRQEFIGFWEPVQAMLAATPPDAVYRWGIFDRAPLRHWSVGRATLLGDAAHPMTPFLGQGGVMALEDALVLSRCLTKYGPGAEALQHYEAARRVRAEFVFEQSRRAGEALTTFDPDTYSPSAHRNEETLGLAAYDAAAVPV